jgi:hypothetical protein
MKAFYEIFSIDTAILADFLIHQLIPSIILNVNTPRMSSERGDTLHHPWNLVAEISNFV